MKTELLNKDGSKTPPRPSWHADMLSIATSAVESMYTAKYCEFELDDKENLIESIVNNWYEHIDNYDLAKRFESDGWDVDSNFLSALESVESYVGGEITKRIREWGETNEIVQPLPIGTELDCGVIDGVYEYDSACYTVKMYEKQSNPTTRRIIRWEDAILK